MSQVNGPESTVKVATLQKKTLGLLSMHGHLIHMNLWSRPAVLQYQLDHLSLTVTKLSFQTGTTTIAYSVLHGLPSLFSYLNLWEPGNQAFPLPVLTYLIMQNRTCLENGDHEEAYLKFILFKKNYIARVDTHLFGTKLACCTLSSKKKILLMFDPQITDVHLNVCIKVLVSSQSLTAISHTLICLYLICFLCEELSSQLLKLRAARLGAKIDAMVKEMIGKTY